MTDREETRKELSQLLDALEQAKKNNDQEAITLFVRDISHCLSLLGW
jgi:hypothetical protein